MPLVEEVASKAGKSSHGWAYIAESSYVDPSKAPLVPADAKRHASSAASKAIAAAALADQPSGHAPAGGPVQIEAVWDPGLGARQNTQLARRVAELDRDAPRDAGAAITGKAAAGRPGAKGKTPATRRILAAQKTFANYLADDEALAAQSTGGGSGHNAAAAAAQAAAARTRAADADRRRAAQFRIVPPLGGPTQPHSLVHVGPAGTPRLPLPAPVLPPMPAAAPGTAGPDGDARLMQVVVPRAPADALMDALTEGAAPLSWGAARARLDPADARRPRRHFCEWCGYWGAVRCRACGARVCGKECYQTHVKERCQGM